MPRIHCILALILAVFAPSSDAQTVSRAMRLHSGRTVGLLLDQPVKVAPAAPFGLAWSSPECSAVGCSHSHQVEVPADRVAYDPAMPAVGFPMPDGIPANVSLTLIAYGQAVPVEDLTGRDITPIEWDAIVMEQGQNLPLLSYHMITPPYADLAKIRSAWFPAQGATIKTDARGELTSVSGGNTLTILGSNSPNGAGGPSGYPGFPAGDYTISVVDTASIATQLNGQPKRSAYAFDIPIASGSYSPSISLGFTRPVKSLKIIPPGESPDALFSSRFLAKLRGFSSRIRAMDSQGINTFGVCNFDEYHTADDPTYSVAKVPAATGRVASIEPHANADGFFQTAPGWVVVKITTAAPHGMPVSRVVTFKNFVDNITVEWSVNGSLNSKITNLSGRSKYARVLDDRSFVTMIWVDGVPLSAAVKPQVFPATSPGVFAAISSSSPPPEHLFLLANELQQDLHLCIPYQFSDADCARMAALARDTLAPGLRLIVEYGNEIWNTGNGFEGYWHCYGNGKLAGIGFKEWGVRRAAEIHDIFEAAMPGRVVRHLGSWNSDPNYTKGLLTQAAAIGKRVDEVSIAPYWRGRPCWNSPAPMRALVDSMSDDQLMDMAELTVASGEPSRTVKGHYDAIKSSVFPDCKLVTYEGGPESMGFAVPVTPASVKRSVGLLNHHRQGPIYAQWCQQIQPYVAVNVDFILSSPTMSDKVWGRWFGADQCAGLGDGSDGLNDNRKDPTALDKAVAVIPYWQRRWESARRANLARSNHPAR